LSLDAPAGWAELFVRIAKVAAVAFVVLQIKELYDAGRFDTLGTAVDAVLIASGTFVLSVIGVGKASRHMAERPPLSPSKSR
jgi:hypothetical protein